MSTMTLRPRANGDTIQATLVAGDSHWEAVDDTSPDGDTTCIKGNSESYLLDLFKLTIPSVQGVISSIVVYAQVRKNISTSPDGTTKLAVKVGGSVYYSAEKSVTTYSTYSEVSNLWATNPATGNAWRMSDVVDLQAGIALLRSGVGHPVYCTQVYVVVNYDNEKSLSGVIIRPSAAGDLTQLTPSASPNWECVNEESASFTDYVRNPAVDGYKTDLYEATDPSVPGQIMYVRVLTRCSSGVINAPVMKTEGTVYYGDEVDNPATQDNIFYWGNNPVTGDPWTIDEINALQIGTYQTQGNCGQVYATVVYYQNTASSRAALIGPLW